MAQVQQLPDMWRLYPHTYAEKMSGGEWIPYPFLKYLGKKVAETVFKPRGRLIVEVPPRHGKSELISHWTPVWFLDINPKHKVILASYEADFAATWGRAARNEIRDNPAVRIELAPDSLAGNRWSTLAGGGMITAGIGGPVTGRGGDLLIIDDPVKNAEQAFSQVYRLKAIDWSKSTFLTRGNPDASAIILMTRWNENDLAGYFQKYHPEWDVVRLPAVAEKGDPIGRKIGEALCPERYPKKVLDQIKNEIGSYFWAAMFQQRPAPEEGGILKRHWWQYYDALPECSEYIQSWDMAFKDTKHSAYVVGQLWGRNKADKYLIDQVRAKMDFPATLKAVKAFTAKWPQAKIKLVEDKANGPAVISSLKNEISGFKPINPRGSKEARAHAVSPQIESGNVYLPRPMNASWVEDFVNECATFPNSEYKDQVDAMTQALDRLEGKKTDIIVPWSSTKVSKISNL